MHYQLAIFLFKGLGYPSRYNFPSSLFQGYILGIRKNLL